MTETAKRKWTEDEVATLLAGYDPERSEATVTELCEKLDRTKRMVIGKLVRENKYVAPEKPAPKPKDEGPTKAQIIEAIAATGFDTSGGEGANKAFLSRIAALVKSDLTD